MDLHYLFVVLTVDIEHAVSSASTSIAPIKAALKTSEEVKPW